MSKEQPWSCYLARPMDQARGVDVGAGMAHAVLQSAGAMIYDPRSVSGRANGSDFYQRVHNAAMRECDAMLALLPDGVPTIGVPIEIVEFADTGKPVAVVCGPVGAASPVLAAQIGVHVSTSLEEAVGYLAALPLGSRPGGTPFPPKGFELTLESLVDPDPGPPVRTDDKAHKLRVHKLATVYAQRSETLAFLADVGDEVERARRKHPRSDDATWTTRDRWFSIWAEEVIEAALGVAQQWNDRGDDVSVREECVQVAAMSMRLWQALGGGSG